MNDTRKPSWVHNNQSSTQTAGDADRELPHNILAERAVLGTIMSNNDFLDKVPTLRPEHFSDPLHQRLYMQIQARCELGELADALTLRDWIEEDADGKANDGIAYLNELLAETQPVHLVAYAGQIARTWQKRILIEASERVKRDAYDPELSFEDLVNGLHDTVNRAMDGRDESHGMTFDTALSSGLAMVREAMERGGAGGIPTGFPIFDRAVPLLPKKFVVLGGATSMGKAQPLHSKVLLKNGSWKRMGDLVLGDEIASVDGAPSRVMAIYPRGTREVFRVTFKDGRSTEACGEHLWKIRRGPQDMEQIVDTRRLMALAASWRAGYISIETVSGHFGHQDALQVDPYVLGALLGDGGLSGDVVRFTSADPEIVAEIEARLDSGVSIKKVVGSYAYSITSRASADRITEPGSRSRPRITYPLREALRGLGLFPINGAEKFIPPCYLSACRPARLDLLRGLLDTDGTAEKSGTIRFSSCSELLARDVVMLARSLGASATLRSVHKTCLYKGERRGKPSFLVTIRHRDGHDFFCLTRKKTRAHRKSHPVRLVVESVVSVGEEDTRCISVTHPSRLYVTDDYIVTHNSSVAWKMAIHAARHLRDLIRAGATDVGWVLGISPEMDAETLALRAACAEAGVPFDEALCGFSEEGRRIKRDLRREGEDWINRDGEVISDAQIEAKAAVARLGKMKKLEASRVALSDLPLHFVSVSPITAKGITKRLHQLRRRYKKVALIVVDYLQYIEPDSTASSGMKDMVNRITNFKNDFDCPVLALSQIKADVAKRPDKKPDLTDLAWASEIQNNADGVVFFHREEYWLSRNQPKQGEGDKESDYIVAMRNWEEAMRQHRGRGQLLIKKARAGRSPVTAEIIWDGPTMCATEDPDQPWPWDQEGG
jgi:replicative DNA helicase